MKDIAVMQEEERRLTPPKRLLPLQTGYAPQLNQKRG